MNFTQLHHLIQNLNSAEHRQVDNSFEDKESKYYQLYDHLVGQPLPFSEKLLKAFCLKINISEGSLRTYRGRLSKQISRQLLLLDAKDNAFFQMQEHLTIARIYIRKEAYELADEELKKAEKLEKEIVHPGSRWEINSLRARQLFQEDERSIEKELDRFHRVMQKAANDFQQQVDINLIYQKLFSHGMRQKKKAQKWQEIIEGIKKIEFPSNASIETKVDYIAIQNRVHLYHKQPAEALKYSQLGFEIFEKNPHLKSNFPRYYITLLDHYISSAAQMELFDLMRDLLGKLDEIITDDPLVASKKQAAFIFHSLTLICYDTSTRDTLSIGTLEQLKTLYEQYASRFLPSRRLSIDYLFCPSYLVRLDYGAAEDIADFFDIHVRNTKRPDLQRIIILVKNFLDVVVNEYENPESIFQRDRNKLYDWGKESDYEVVVLRNIQNIRECPPTRAAKKEVYDKFKEELLATADPHTQKMHSGAILFDQLLTALKKRLK